VLGLFEDYVHGIKRCSARQNLLKIRIFSSAVEHFAWDVLVLPSAGPLQHQPQITVDSGVFCCAT
jgi:hypothetical protein